MLKRKVCRMCYKQSLHKAGLVPNKTQMKKFDTYWKDGLCICDPCDIYQIRASMDFVGGLEDAILPIHAEPDKGCPFLLEQIV